MPPGVASCRPNGSTRSRRSGSIISHNVADRLKIFYFQDHTQASDTGLTPTTLHTGHGLQSSLGSPARQLLVTFALLWLILAACSTPGLPPLDENFMTTEDERLLWRQSEREQTILDTSGLIYEHAEIEAYLNQIAARLRPPDTPADLIFRIKIIKNPYLNAFAFPNGVIYAHSGLLARMDNEAQLAALLAHEMAHCSCRHALQAHRRIQDRSKWVAAGRNLLVRIDGLKDLVGFLGAAGTIIAANRYTRELESEADREGLRMLIRAGYAPEEALNLFEHLREEIQHEKIQEPFFFGSHPKIEQRLAELRSVMVSEEPIDQSLTTPRELFLAKVLPVILENARLDLKLGRFQTARRGVQKYLAVRSNDARAHFLMGEIHRQRGQSTDASIAISCYQQAIEIDPSYAAPYKAIGLLHYKGGQKQLARRFFQTSLLLAPEIPDRAYIEGYLDNL